MRCFVTAAAAGFALGALLTDLAIGSSDPAASTSARRASLRRASSVKTLPADATAQGLRTGSVVPKPSDAVKNGATRVVTPADGSSIPKPTYDVTAGLAISRCDAGRDGSQIRIIGVVQNVALRAIPFSFKISKWNGSAWTLIQEGGTRMVQSKGSMNAQATMPSTNDSVRLKFEISGGKNEHVVKEYRLALKQVSYVVRYRTTNGAKVLCFDTGKDSNSLAKDTNEGIAKSRANLLRSAGFTTTFHSATSIGIPRDYVRVTLQAELKNSLERTFPTQAEAQRFRQKIQECDSMEPSWERKACEISIAER